MTDNSQHRKYQVVKTIYDYRTMTSIQYHTWIHWEAGLTLSPLIGPVVRAVDDHVREGRGIG